MRLGEDGEGIFREVLVAVSREVYTAGLAVAYQLWRALWAGRGESVCLQLSSLRVKTQTICFLLKSKELWHLQCSVC